MPRDRRTDWSLVAPLGLLTLAAYGAWIYGFGVQVEAMAADLGWSTGRLGLAFGAAQLISGIGAFGVGVGLDRLRPAPVLGVTGLLGCLLLGGSAHVGSPVLFSVLYGVGGGLVGGAGFYSATMGVIVRRVRDPHPSIGSLTIIGAFCAPIFIPIIRALTIRHGWRPVLTSMSGLTAVTFCVVVARLWRTERPETKPPGGLFRGIPGAVRGSSRIGRALLVSSFLVGVGVGVAIAFQIPTMTSAGLASATAAGLASFRALMQLGGRLPLTPIVAAVGARRALIGAYLLSAAGLAALVVSDRLWVGVVYAVLAGAGFGAMSPLHGMVGAEELDPASMGALLGVQAALTSLGSALGPAIAGIVKDATGSYVPGGLVAVVASVGAAIVLWWSGRALPA